MKTYYLRYVQQFDDATEEELLWRCEAEDLTHAKEQLLDAEEGVVQIMIERTVASDTIETLGMAQEN